MYCSTDSEDLASEELKAEMTSVVEVEDSKKFSDGVRFKLLTSSSNAVSVALSERLDVIYMYGHLNNNYIVINQHLRT